MAELLNAGKIYFNSRTVIEPSILILIVRMPDIKNKRGSLTLIWPQADFIIGGVRREVFSFVLRMVNIKNKKDREIGITYLR